MTSKRQHKENNLKLKYKLYWNWRLENKGFSKFFNVSLNTIFTWKKKKAKIFDAFHQQNVTKRVNVDPYDQVHKTVLKWFKRMVDVQISGSLLKEKTS